MKKRITLPKNFKELLEKGDLDALKAIYKKCDVNARGGGYYANAFSMAPLPKEFAFWLKEQGADINAPSQCGETPIFNHCSAPNGDPELLIALGADVNALGRDEETPLHSAARYVRIEAADALIRHGANVNARHNDRFWNHAYTPMEVALLEARGSVEMLASLCKLLLASNAEITEISRNAVKTIGEDYEFCKSGYDDDVREQCNDALKWLYEAFDVTPVAPIEIHDGISPIVIRETDFAKQYNKLWEYLVPPSGSAKTAQGEVIRIVGKVSHEIFNNGGANWDKDFEKMLHSLPQYFALNNSLPEKDMQEVKRLIKRVRIDVSDAPKKLAQYAVAWVLSNQNVIAVIPHDYKR